MKSLFLMPVVGLAAILTGLFLITILFVLTLVIVPILASVGLIKSFSFKPFKNVALA